MNAKGEWTEREKLILRVKAIELAAAIQELMYCAGHDCGTVRPEQARQRFANALVDLAG